MTLVNISEAIVRERLDSMLQNYDCCKCQTCYMDMLALVLNYVKPRYVNSHKGELLTRVNALHLQNSVDIDIAIIKAIELVSHSPHHDTENQKEKD